VNGQGKVMRGREFSALEEGRDAILTDGRRPGAGRNLLNSETLSQNLLNTTEEDLRNAEEGLHKAGC
jgi:hypothetical protein